MYGVRSPVPAAVPLPPRCNSLNPTPEKAERAIESLEQDCDWEKVEEGGRDRNARGGRLCGGLNDEALGPVKIIAQQRRVGATREMRSSETALYDFSTSQKSILTDKENQTTRDTNSLSIYALFQRLIHERKAGDDWRTAYQVATSLGPWRGCIPRHEFH